MKEKLIQTDDIDFMSETRAALKSQVPKGARILIWGTLAFFSSAIVWAKFAEIDQITRGVGQVIPSRHVQEIQNLEGGIVSEVKVKEGEIVEEGQILLRIDDTRFSSSYRGSHLELLALKAKAARLKAESNNTDLIFPDDVIKGHAELATQEESLFNSRKEEYENNLNIFEDQVKQAEQALAELKAKKGQTERSYNLAYSELSLTRPLVKEGAISRVEVIRLERQVNDLRGELERTKLAIPGGESKLEEAKRKLEEVRLSFQNDAQTQLNATFGELSKLSTSNEALEDRVNRTLVRSPVKGIVKQILTNTIGGVIQPGDVMLEIVPLEDTLLVEAKVRPADIAFLHPSQKAIVKFTAYDFAIHGGLEADVVHISADTITDEKDESFYLVRVQTNQNYLGNDSNALPIIPGMTAEVDIITGKNTVLDYVLKPVLRAKSRALTER